MVMARIVQGWHDSKVEEGGLVFAEQPTDEVLRGLRLHGWRRRRSPYAVCGHSVCGTRNLMTPEGDNKHQHHELAMLVVPLALHVT